MKLPVKVAELKLPPLKATLIKNCVPGGMVIAPGAVNVTVFEPLKLGAQITESSP